jgi:tripartite-type tricarboxylate transporter receptor subunit TctC
MTPQRRRFLQWTAAAAALPVLGGRAPAETYPARQARLIVGFSAGAGADIAARLVGQWLTDRLGQAFVVENRPGAGGNIAAEMVVRAPGDGYTLLLINTSNAINATLYDKLSFSLVENVAPVAGVFSGPFVLVVKPSFPAKTLAEFIAYAKANPGRINMASPGIGSAPHLAGELLKIKTGINMVHVPYRGVAPALTDLIGGQVQTMFASLPSTLPYFGHGKLRPLAVTSLKPWPALPNVPTMAALLPGYEASAWYGIGAPKNTPAEIVSTLNAAINKSLADPQSQARLADLGGAVIPGSPADFGKLIVDETAKWGEVIKAAHLKAN